MARNPYYIVTPGKVCLECNADISNTRLLSSYCSKACAYRARRLDLREVFEQRTDRSGGSGACWDWTGRFDRKGYGVIGVCWPKSQNLRAHRVSWELHRGPIADGLLVCHKCDRPRCVNPDHLFLGTHADNNADRHSKGRTPLGEQNYKAVLNPTLVREIRALKARGIKQRAISEQLNVPIGAVGGVFYGNSWKHVTEAEQ